MSRAQEAILEADEQPVAVEAVVGRREAAAGDRADDADRVEQALSWPSSGTRVARSSCITP